MGDEERGDEGFEGDEIECEVESDDEMLDDGESAARDDEPLLRETSFSMTLFSPFLDITDGAVGAEGAE